MAQDEYSFSIFEELIEKLDLLAQEMRVDRSHIVNQILTEYFSANLQKVSTEDIFYDMLHTLDDMGLFRVSGQLPQKIINLKSTLKNEHRPEIKYVVELNDEAGARFVKTTALLRTNELETLQRFNQFARVWMQIDENHLQSNLEINYFLENGRFTHKIKVREDFSKDALLKFIERYIKELDNALKLYLINPNLDHIQIEKIYIQLIDV